MHRLNKIDLDDISFFGNHFGTNQPVDQQIKKTDGIALTGDIRPFLQRPDFRHRTLHNLRNLFLRKPLEKRATR